MVGIRGWDCAAVGPTQQLLMPWVTVPRTDWLDRTLRAAKVETRKNRSYLWEGMALNRSEYSVLRVAQKWVSVLPALHTCGDHWTHSTVTWIKLPHERWQQCWSTGPTSYPAPKYANVSTWKKLFAKSSRGQHKNWLVFVLNIQASNIGSKILLSKVLEIPSLW